LAFAVALTLSIIAIFSVVFFRDAANSFAATGGSSPNGLSMGRYDIAVMLWEKLRAASTLNWFIGFGAGSADAVSEVTANLNPHNDWLKVMFDYGILGLCVVHMMFFLILARHRLGIMMYLYTATLMMTDNVFIYLYYYPFIAMAMCTERP
jgi:O-antigen ligase